MSDTQNKSNKKNPNNETDNPIITFAQLQKMIINDLNRPENNWKSNNIIYSKYTKEEVIEFLSQPARYEKQLRNLVRFLYINSPHFRQLISYFANMLSFDYIVEPYGLGPTSVKKSTFQDQYQKVLDFLDNMNLKHELNKLSHIVMREDIVYGYEYSAKDSYFIKILDPSLCAVSSIEDGIRNFAFDFSFFDRNTKYLNKYPEEFTTKYLLYRKDKTGKRWQELDSNKTVCLKFNEDLNYVVPLFVSIIGSIFDLNESREREKQKHRIENYMVLAQKVPMRSKDEKVNGFLLDMTTINNFHNMALNSVPEDIGVITSPMDIDAIKLDRPSSPTVASQQTQKDFYSDAGVSQFLFNTDSVTSSGLAASVRVDEQNMFAFLRQIERWINRKLKQVTKTYKFRVKFLNITNQNRSDTQKSLLSAAQSGVPVKMQLAAAYGLSPSATQNMAFLENEVLNLSEKFVPLSTSFTQSGSASDGGRPQSSDDELSESGEKTRETDENEER